MLGHFESAPRSNLPCMREDGSYNMVADDGQICGTAPEWGYPLWCCQQLWSRSGDIRWLKRLYPGAAAYMRWWLDHRRDSEGWEIYGCSWESGQDVSSRFGPQQTGGTIIQHLRPVDLQASIAQSAAILSSWAELLSPTHRDETIPNPYTADIVFWHEIANEFTEKTRSMWRDGWFRDYDSVASIWSSERDTMHLAPVFCGVATPEQVEQLRAYLEHPPKHSSGWAPLSWPPVVMTLVGAAEAAGMSREASELAYHFIGASFRSTDSRELDEHGGLPGVTREYRQPVTIGKWGAQDYVNAGIEGYGWGAVSVHLLMRYLIGLHEEEAGKVTLAPMFPQSLRRAGAVYRVGPIPWGKYEIHVACTVRDAQHYHVQMQCIVPPPEPDALTIDLDALSREPIEQQWEWEGSWGEAQSLQLP